MPFMLLLLPHLMGMNRILGSAQEEEPEPHLVFREGFPKKGLTSKQEEMLARQRVG